MTPLTYGQEIAAGIANAQFVQLDSRNHITNIYGKLGVKTRAQAMVRAREQGFGTA